MSPEGGGEGIQGRHTLPWGYPSPEERLSLSGGSRRGPLLKHSSCCPCSEDAGHVTENDGGASVPPSCPRGLLGVEHAGRTCPCPGQGPAASHTLPSPGVAAESVPK